MNHREFKFGDIVRCVSNNCDDKGCKGKIGKIVSIDSLPPYCVEFSKPVEHGHEGRNNQEKYKCCRWFRGYEIKLYREPILKIFLKEKEKKA